MAQNLHFSSSRPELGAAERLSSGIVGLGIAETTPSIPLLGDDSSCALAGVEAAAATAAVGVAGAGAGDKLRAGCGGAGVLSASILGAGILRTVVLRTGVLRAGILRVSALGSARVGSGAAAEGLGGGVVGLGVAEATASVPLLGDDRAGALAGVEAAAATLAISIALASPGDELSAGALGDSQEGD